MESFSCVFGNEKLRERLASDIREGMMSHAYIIEGDKGCGKHTLARAVAAALACENAGDGGYNLPCGVCPSCKKILAGKSPDVITVSREAGKTQMGVEVIRGLREDVRLMPNDLDVKVYIIEDAHTMNDHAQNAFLLTLEEPPEFVKFLLLCESAENLLETVKSRAPVLRMSTLENALLRQKLIEISPEAAELSRNSKKEFEEIIKLSSGCLGQAIELLSEDTRAPRIEARHLAIELLLCLTERRNAKKEGIKNTRKRNKANKNRD